MVTASIPSGTGKRRHSYKKHNCNNGATTVIIAIMTTTITARGRGGPYDVRVLCYYQACCLDRCFRLYVLNVDRFGTRFTCDLSAEKVQYLGNKK